MLKRDRKLFDGPFIGGVVRILSVTGFSVLAGFAMISIFPLEINDHGIFTLGAKLLLITAVTFIVHLVMSALFGLDEAKAVFNRLRRMILRPIRIDY